MSTYEIEIVMSPDELRRLAESMGPTDAVVVTASRRISEGYFRLATFTTDGES